MIVLHPPNVTSVLRYFGPTRTWFISSFQMLLVRRTYMSDTHSLEKISVSDLQVSCTLLQIGCRPFVGQMNNLSRLDAQFLQVGFTTFGRSDAQLLQVECTIFVGRMHTFCRSDKHILQVRCTKCRKDAHIWQV